MALTVNYNVTPFLITVPKSDLALITGTQYQLTVDDFWILLRDFTDNEGTMAQPILYGRIPATSSTPSITTINDAYYAIQFEDGLYSVNIINGNTNIRETEVKNSVSVNTNNTTGFIDPTFLQASTFGGTYGDGVVISPLSGTDGITYPIGTRAAPCRTEDNFHDIGSNRGFNTIYVKDSLTLTGSNGSGYIFAGDNPQAVNVHCDVGSDVSGCKFQDCYITGKLDTLNTLWECIVGDVTNVNGFVYKCALLGTVTISDHTNFEDCFISSMAPGQQITIDFDGQAKTVIVANLSAGRIFVNNMVPGSFLGVAGTGGAVTLGNASTGGTVSVGGATIIDRTNEGLYDLINDSSIADSSAGAIWTHDDRTLTSQSEVDEAAIADAVWTKYLNDGGIRFTGTHEELLTIAKEMLYNKAVVSSDKRIVTIYADNGIDVRYVIDVSADELERTPRT